MLAVAFDRAQMGSFRADPAANLRRELAGFPELAPRLAGASPASRVFSSGRLLNTYRVPVCDGALLLGDAGLHVDPLFGQGHSLALVSAELMAALAPGWFAGASGAALKAGALAEFTARRDGALKGYYESTVNASRVLGLEPEMLMVYRAASSAQWAADEMLRFANLLAPPSSFPSFRFARLIARQRSREN